LNDPEYKGEPVDKKLKNGPLDERSCTDILCLIVFIVFWVLFGLMCAKFISQGDPSILAVPYDGSGKYYKYIM